MNREAFCQGYRQRCLEKRASGHDYYHMILPMLGAVGGIGLGGYMLKDYLESEKFQKELKHRLLGSLAMGGFAGLGTGAGVLLETLRQDL